MGVLMADREWKADTGKYRLLYDLGVRCGPGLDYPMKNGNYYRESYLTAGSELEVMELKKLSLSVWGNTKEGWICICMKQKVLAEKIEE